MTLASIIHQNIDFKIGSGDFIPCPANQNNLLNPDAIINSSTHHINQLHLGNCINIMQSMPANSIDLILTDPPYLVNYRDRTGRTIIGDKQGQVLNEVDRYDCVW